MKAEWFKHITLLMVILLGISIVYGRVRHAYFCSYDDHIELHRAAFEDSREPSRVFTTPHFASMYRPVNRAVNLATYWIGDGSPTFFRTRNVAFHLVNVILVYVLGWLLFRSIYVSGIAATVFGFHPFSNQAVIGAVMTNTMAHTEFLVAVVMFIIAVRSRLWPLWLTGSLVFGWLGLMTFESSIVVFGLMAVYLVVCVIVPGKQFVGRRFIAVFLLMSGVLLSCYLLLRSLFVPKDLAQASSFAASLTTIVKNLLMYSFALVSPLDPVLAHEWLETPLPSEIQMSNSEAIFFGSLVLIVFSIFAVAVGQWIRRKCLTIDWADVIFLLSGILAPLLPVLVFRSHPSETYLYLSVAFYAVLLSYGVVGVIVPALATRSKAIVIVTVLLVTAFFGAATWVRNGRVAECGKTARRILQSLPRDLLKSGAWTISFANIPGEKVTNRYGFYGFRGIDTIGHGPGAKIGISSAVQLAYQNEYLRGDALEWNEFVSRCRNNLPERHLCVLVHSDGRIESLDANLAPLTSRVATDLDTH
jgi:hypothetical protein